jgi:hypothetical protein
MHLGTHSIRIAMVNGVTWLPLMRYDIRPPLLLLLLLTAAAAAGARARAGAAVAIPVGTIVLPPQASSRSIFQAAQGILGRLWAAAAVTTTAEHAVQPPAGETV